MPRSDRAGTHRVADMLEVPGDVQFGGPRTTTVRVLTRDELAEWVRGVLDSNSPYRST